MDWGKLKFFLGEVARNFTRNAGMQITAIGTVAVTIVLLGAFLYVRAALAHLGSDVLNQIEISVYLKPDVSAAQTATLRTRLAQDERIRSVRYIPKSEGLRELRARMQGQIDTTILTENPLPDKMRVRVRRPEDVPFVAKNIRAMPGVATADYGQAVVARLLQLGAVARRVGIALIVMFVIIAGIIISNTIRLTVFARRREIAVMQLVGATNMYIRMPFICEGMLDGIVGALVAVGLLMLARGELLAKFNGYLPWLRLNATQADLSAIFLELLVAGAIVGIVSSWIAVGRYLRT